MAAIFLANAAVSNSLAGPCMHHENLAVKRGSIPDTMKESMPCQEAVQNDQSMDNETCCEGMCLKCFAPHVHLGLTTESFLYGDNGEEKRFLTQSNFLSLAFAPPRRPPKPIS